jgi:BCD family chlorophyll transporter-like MFS transporter
VGTLSAAMRLRDASQHGIALGAWGAVFATAEGLSFALSGVLKDWLSHLVGQGALGPGLSHPVVPYAVVYQLEILALFATLAALGPLVARRWRADEGDREPAPAFGLADLPA